MKNQILQLTLILILLPSCIVKSPKYTSVKQVMALEVGMTRKQVDSILRLHPYDIKSKTDTSTVYVYIYRLDDRRTLSINTKPLNGRVTNGKYEPLAVTYSKDSIMLAMESCSLCREELMSVSKVNFEKVLSFLMITAPALLIYLGLKSK